MSILAAPLGFRRFFSIASLSFVFIFGAVWVWVLKERLAFLDLNYPVWTAKMALVEGGHLGDFIIFGDSTSCADLVPERLGPGVVNLSLVGASTIEEYFLIRRTLSASKQPKAVILSYPPEHLIGTDDFWEYGVGFGLVRLGEIEEVRARCRALGEAAFFGAESPGDIDARLKGLLYTIRSPSFYFPAIVHARVFGRYAANFEKMNYVLANQGYAGFGEAKGSTHLDGNTKIKSFVTSKISDDYFDKTLAFFHDRNIPVYFISMPCNEVSSRLYSPDLRGALAAYLDQYSRRYPTFHVLGDCLPAYPFRYFGDSSHLNYEGAVVWSDYVAKLLNDANVPGGPFGLTGGRPEK